MTETMKHKDKYRDYYKATLENGSLVMNPHCACRNALNADYFCEKCNKRAHCHLIICDTEDALHLVERYIRVSPQFSAYTAYLSNE